MKKIQVAYADDWEGLYVDGKLVWEGHNIPWSNLMERLGINLEWISVDDNWLFDRGGNLPEKIEDVKSQGEE